jgi:hypothetical protein
MYCQYKSRYLPCSYEIPFLNRTVLLPNHSVQGLRSWWQTPAKCCQEVLSRNSTVRLPMVKSPITHGKLRASQLSSNLDSTTAIVISSSRHPIECHNHLRLVSCISVLQTGCLPGYASLQALLRLLEDISSIRSLTASPILAIEFGVCLWQPLPFNPALLNPYCNIYGLIISD